MVAHSHCVSRGRVLDAGAAADGCLASAFHYLSDPGVARRRLIWRAPGRSPRGRGCRLVIWFRLFSRWALLDRPRISGRRQDVRVVAAVRGGCAAGSDGGLHRVGARARATDLDEGRYSCARACRRPDLCRMAPRPPVHRLSLECLWLRADLAAMACPGRRAHRHLGSHLLRRCALRLAGRARRRSCAHATTLAALRARRGRDRGACDLRRRADGADSDAICGRRSGSHYATEPAARREVQLFAEAGGDEPLSRLIGTRVTIHGLARCNSSDLAGIGVSFLPRARTGSVRPILRRLMDP